MLSGEVGSWLFDLERRRAETFLVERFDLHRSFHRKAVVSGFRCGDVVRPFERTIVDECCSLKVLFGVGDRRGSVKKEKGARSIVVEVDGVDVDTVQITRSSERQRRSEGTGRRRVSALTPS